MIFALLTLESLETASFDEDGEGREEEHDAQNITKEIVGALLFTVLISVFAHGYSAAPLAEMYAAYMAKKKKEGRPVTIDLDLPDITVRMRGTARNTSIPPEVLQARSLNMSRLRSERDLLMDRQASAQMEVKVNEDGTITAASLNIEPCEDSDTTIHLPYTKTANTTLIRSGSLQLEPLNFSHTNENNYDHLAAIREASTEDMNISFHDALKHENKTEIVEKNDV